MNKQKIIFQIVAVLVLCVLLETVSYFILRAQHKQVGYLFNFNFSYTVHETKGFGFNEIDPLCGWAMSNKTLESMGYEVVENCEVLRSKGAFPEKPLRIFITGGSTSDIGLHTDNWPNELHRLFIQHKINAEIYAGGVGGYSSGQELLKLLRDGLRLNPDVHISYTGANDASDGGYVSEYEESFYQTAYRQSSASALMPATVYLVKQALHISYNDLALKKTEPMSPFFFWKQNMEAMSGIAQKNKYRFIGILQPVLGMGNYRQANAKDIDPGKYSELYQGYFPQAKEFILKSDTTLRDLTNIFDTVKGQVFLDDCHLHEAYQPLVATHVYLLLVEAGYVPNN